MSTTSVQTEVPKLLDYFELRTFLEKIKKCIQCMISFLECLIQILHTVNKFQSKSKFFTNPLRVGCVFCLRKINCLADYEIQKQSLQIVYKLNQMWRNALTMHILFCLHIFVKLMFSTNFLTSGFQEINLLGTLQSECRYILEQGRAQTF